MPDYRYELRRGDEVLATGHLSREQPHEVGERIVIGGRPGIVRTIEPLLGERELRLGCSSGAKSLTPKRARGGAPRHRDRMHVVRI
jgi:hypothetical protein